MVRAQAEAQARAEKDPSSEAELIKNIKDGQRASFDNLVNMYRQKGIRIAYNLVGNLEDAKDVLQEAFIKVYLSIKSFKENAKFSTWFYRILVNCGLDFLRMRKSKKMMLTEALSDEDGKMQEFADTHNEPTGIILNRELSQKLDNCIASLSEKQRLCFVLKHQNGLKNQEIAEILKCRVSTVKVHLFRAVNALQARLSGYLCR